MKNQLGRQTRSLKHCLKALHAAPFCTPRFLKTVPPCKEASCNNSEKGGCHNPYNIIPLQEPYDSPSDLVCGVGGSQNPPCYLNTTQHTSVCTPEPPRFRFISHVVFRLMLHKTQIVNPLYPCVGRAA